MDARPFRVLVVDDDPTVLALCRRVLANLLPEGAVVDTVAGGAEALKAIRARDYDVLLSDVVMPGMDGLTLLEHARSEAPHTLRLLFTSSEEAFLVARARERSLASGAVRKPSIAEDLRENLREL